MLKLIKKLLNGFLKIQLVEQKEQKIGVGGDSYPEIVEQKILTENIEKEITTALKRNTYNTIK